MKKIGLMVIIVFIIHSFTGCNDGSGVASNDISVEEFNGIIIHNRSQFELEHVYIYTTDKGYSESESLIEAPLAVGELLLHQAKANNYFITVTRKANQDSELSAYTTTQSVELKTPMVIEYYDSEFRAYNIKLSTTTQNFVSDKSDSNESNATK
mgnify:CR=1 FL=1|jgi:hypothetical protein